MAEKALAISQCTDDGEINSAPLVAFMMAALFGSLVITEIMADVSITSRMTGTIVLLPDSK